MKEDKNQDIHQAVLDAKKEYTEAEKKYRDAGDKLFCLQDAERFYDDINNDKFVFFHIDWLKENTSPFYLLSVLLKHKPTVGFAPDFKRAVLHIPKALYAKETQTEKTNAYSRCLKEIEIDEFYSFKLWLLPREVAENFHSISKAYTGQSDIMTALLMTLRQLKKQSGKLSAFCTTNKFLSEQTGYSIEAVRRAMNFLVDLGVLVKYSSGTVFTSGSLYNFNIEV